MSSSNHSQRPQLLVRRAMLAGAACALGACATAPPPSVPEVQTGSNGSFVITDDVEVSGDVDAATRQFSDQRDDGWGAQFSLGVPLRLGSLGAGRVTTLASSVSTYRRRVSAAGR